MKLTLSIEGHPQHLVEILRFAQSLEEAAPSKELTLPKSHSASMGSDLVRFCESNTPQARKLLWAISEASIDGRYLRPAELMDAVGLEDTAENEMKLMGFLGGIGRRWANGGSGVNPFKGRRDPSSNEYRHRIDKDLAQEIIDILVVSGDR